MKSIFKALYLFIIAAVFITACDKKDSLPYYNNGTAPTFTLSSAALTPAPSDSDNVALTATWTNPSFAVDSSSVKYVVQIDSAGRNFSKAVSKMVSGALSTTFTAKDLNSIALGYGFAFNTAYSLDVRLIASYANNNDQKISNVVTIQYTPYKIPPKVALPASGELYLVGDATQGGWSNPVPAPAQKFMQVDETTWSGVFQLNGGGQYLVLPVNGSWDHKFAAVDKSAANSTIGGDFNFDAKDNFPGPATSGLYVITLNFQSGKYSVTPYAGAVLPENLFIVGDATQGGWNNPVPTPSQQFTRVNSSMFEITVNLNGGKQYLLLPVNGDWGHKFATEDPSAGTKMMGSFKYDASSNFPAPDESGTYKMEVNFVTNTYKLTKQ